jgi:septal ring factor EnvC (AmiA/AmiB activator)
MEGGEMSETPISDSTPHNVADLGMRIRMIERELHAANSIIRQQQLLDEANLRLQDRIKRLEEELERTKQDRNAIAKKTREPLLLKLDHAADRIKRLEEAGDRLAAFTPPSSDRIAQWNKAKEAKP